MGALGFEELSVILAVAFLLIGPKRLPEIARAMGEAVRAFQDALREPTDTQPSPTDAHTTPPPSV